MKLPEVTPYTTETPGYADDFNKRQNELKERDEKIADQLRLQDAITVPLKRGLNIVESEQSGPVDFAIEGQTRVNMLGDKGFIKAPLPLSSTRTSKDFFFFEGSGTNNMERSINGEGLSVGKTLGTGSLVVDSESLKLSQGKKYIIGFNLNGSTQTSTNLTLYNERLIGELRRVYQGLAGKKTVRLLFDGSFEVNSMRVGISSENNMHILAFGKVCVFELTDAEYSEALTLSDAQLAEKYPYIDGVQHVRNPVITKKGKNLIPPYAMGDASIGAYGSKLPATGSYNSGSFSIPVIPGQRLTMTVKFKEAGSEFTGATLAQRWRATETGPDLQTDTLDMNASFATADGYRTQTRTVPQGMYFARFYWWRSVSYNSTKDVEFTEMILSVGDGNVPFQPQNNDHLYFPDTLLGSSLGGTVRDSIYKKEGNYVLRSVMHNNLHFTGVEEWDFREERNGLSFFSVLMNGMPYYKKGRGLTNFTVCYKDGSVPRVLPQIGDYTTHFRDVVNSHSVSLYGNEQISNRHLYVAVPTTLIGSSDLVSFKNFLEKNPIILSFQLENPIERSLKEEGDISLNSGSNLLEFGEGAIIREKIETTALYNGLRYINGGGERSKLKNRALSILHIYKDGFLDTAWSITNRSPNTDQFDSYGFGRASIEPSKFDENATYSVTYLALDKHTITTALTKAIIAYQSSFKAAFEKEVERNTDTKDQVTVHELMLAEVVKTLRQLKGV